jgi:hypothetical protein
MEAPDLMSEPSINLLASSLIMRGLWLFNIVSYFCMFSPPILLGFAWARFLQREDTKPQPKWRRILGVVNLFAVSALLVVCVVKFLGYHCNADAGDWSCVIAWRSFASSIVRLAPFLLALAILGAKRTRILTFIAVIAIVFDVILVDMWA